MRVIGVSDDSNHIIKIGVFDRNSDDSNRIIHIGAFDDCNRTTNIVV
jgi:hypothetical protein